MYMKNRTGAAPPRAASRAAPRPPAYRSAAAVLRSRAAGRESRRPSVAALFFALRRGVKRPGASWASQRAAAA
eukprot:6211143-Pleurochrysis_carterae.AAC.5